MKLEDIRELIKLIDESSIDEFEYEKDGSKVLIKKHTGAVVQHVMPTQVPVNYSPSFESPQASAQQGNTVQTTQHNSDQQETEESSNLHKIVSPMVGTFYTASSPDAEPFVKAGSKVSQDSVVCIVEAMKLFNEIEADVKGIIAEVLVENGQLVEYGQPLFLVKTE